MVSQRERLRNNRRLNEWLVEEARSEARSLVAVMNRLLPTASIPDQLSFVERLMEIGGEESKDLVSGVLERAVVYTSETLPALGSAPHP
jgi:hypothetical protein